MKKIFDKEKLFFFIRKPRFALVISVCIVILGIISILSLKQESYPDVTSPGKCFSLLPGSECRSNRVICGYST